jgi:hypothetical protein
MSWKGREVTDDEVVDAASKNTASGATPVIRDGDTIRVRGPESVLVLTVVEVAEVLPEVSSADTLKE